MVVLAAGMEPAAKSQSIPADLAFEANGFIDNARQPAGMYGCGVARRPDDVASSVQDATGAALKSIQSNGGLPKAAEAVEMSGGN